MQETTLDPSFDVETVDTYELGLKSRLSDTTTFNITFFDSVFENFQLLQFTGTSFKVVTADEVTTTGFETELLVNPMDGLNISLNYQNAEAEYTKPFTLIDPQRGPLVLTGRTINLAPEHSASLSASYTRPIRNTDYKATIYGAYSYESEYSTYAGLIAGREQDDYTMLMARLGVHTLDDKYGLELWCRNCTDEAVAQIIFQSPIADDSTFAFMHPPLEWGITLSARY